MPKAAKPAAPGKKSNPAATSTARVPALQATPMADLIVLDAEARPVLFAEKAQINRVTFSEMGKLHVLIADDLARDNAAHPRRKARTIYEELRKLGVKDSSISNASYAARTWRELVTPELLTEVQFDTLTFQDCYAICRSMGEKSKLPLDAASVAELIAKQPETFDDELRSLYEYGVTVAEKTAQDAAAEQRKIDAAAALQTAAANAAAAAAANAAQAAQAAQTPPAPAPVATTPTVATGGNSAVESSAGQSTEDAASGTAGAPTVTAADSNEQEQEHEEETGSTGEPTNITTMPPPPADPDANLGAILEVLYEIPEASEQFTPAAQQALLVQLDELRATIAARLAENPVEVAAVA